MEKIHKEKETLDILLKENGNCEEKRLPRYLISGEESLKSLSLPDALCKLLDDYSKKFKVTKKEIVKIALIEFFRKYGREEEIDKILGG